MEHIIKGIHHITAIAGSANRNHDFYTRILGLRMVKKTVNFDDPKTYHLYYGDEKGTPGCILTFFPGAKYLQAAVAHVRLPLSVTQFLKPALIFG